MVAGKSDFASTQALNAAHGPAPVVVNADGAASVTIPGNGFLLDAEFQRSGPDLVLRGEDGREVVVTGYFAQAHPPALTTPGGAVVQPDLAAKLAGPIAPAQFAQAANAGAQLLAVGRVDKASGTVEVVHPDGTRGTLHVGDVIYKGDVIATKGDAAVGITFADASTFSLGKAGRMVIDELVYDPQAQAGQSAISVVKGAFAFASGQIAKTAPEAATIKTPVMTIGIRGTSGAGRADDAGGENTIVLLPDADGNIGQVLVFNSAGVQVLNSSFQQVAVFSPFQPPTPPSVIQAAVVQALYGHTIDNRPPPPPANSSPQQIVPDFRPSVPQNPLPQQPAAPQQGTGTGTAPEQPVGDSGNAGGAKTGLEPIILYTGSGKTEVVDGPKLTTVLNELKGVQAKVGLEANKAGADVQVEQQAAQQTIQETVKKLVDEVQKVIDQQTSETKPGTGDNTNTDTTGQQQPGGETGGSTVTFNGRAIDGYVAGAIVFRDLDNNGTQNGDEPSTRTDGSGNYYLPGTGGTIVVQGGTGTDTTTGELLLVTMKAPPGSSVVTPLTTLVVAVAGSGVSPDYSAAESKVQSMLGLSGVSLTTLDPIASIGTPAGKAVLAATVQTVATINALTTAFSAMGMNPATYNAASIINAMANMAQGGGGLSLSSPASLGSLIMAVTGAGSLSPEWANVATALGGTNSSLATSISTASSFDSSLTNQVKAAISTSGSLSTVINNTASGTWDLTDIKVVKDNLAALKAAGATTFKIDDNSGTNPATFSVEEAAGLTISITDPSVVVNVTGTGEQFAQYALKLNPGFSNYQMTSNPPTDPPLTLAQASALAGLVSMSGGYTLVTAGTSGNDQLDLSNMFEAGRGWQFSHFVRDGANLKMVLKDAGGLNTSYVVLLDHFNGKAVEAATDGHEPVRLATDNIGTAGDDFFFGNGGVTTMWGNAGAGAVDGGEDTFYYNGGANVFVGGGGDDKISFAASSTHAVTMSSGVDEDGYGTALVNGQTQVFSGVKEIVGSQTDDTLIGYENGTSPNTTFWLTGGKGNDDLWDGGGGNTGAAYDDDPGAIVADLEAGTVTDGWGNTDTLHGITRLRASAFDDDITGSSSQDFIEGGLGDDTIDGAGQFDTVGYGDNDGRVVVDLDLGIATQYATVNGVEVVVGTDTLSNVEGIHGSDYSDTLLGKSGEGNWIDGGAGNDFIDGVGGGGFMGSGDQLFGGAGNDTIVMRDGTAADGGTGTDTLVMTGDLNLTGEGPNLDHFEIIDLGATGSTLTLDATSLQTLTEGNATANKLIVTGTVGAVTTGDGSWMSGGSGLSLAGMAGTYELFTKGALSLYVQSGLNTDSIQGATPDSAVSGYGMAGVFDGTHYATTEVNGFGPSENFTIDLWVNPAGMATWGDARTLFSQVGGYDFSADADTLNISGTIGDDGVVSFVVGGHTLNTAAGAVSSGEWAHLAFVRSGDTLQIFVDGHSVAGINGIDLSAFVPSEDPQVLAIGADGGMDGGFFADEGSVFQGQIDEFRVWSTALSATDVRTYMNETPPEDAPISGALDLVYQFDEGGSTLIDLVQSNNATTYVVDDFDGTVDDLDRLNSGVADELAVSSSGMLKDSFLTEETPSQMTIVGASGEFDSGTGETVYQLEYGTLRVNGSGDFVYIPNVSADAVETIYYSYVSGLSGESSVGTLHITINDNEPVLETGDSIDVQQSGATVLTRDMLRMVDPEGDAVVYSVAGVNVGSLLLNGNPLGQNGTFTQADVDAGLLSYVHNSTKSIGHLTLQPMDPDHPTVPLGDSISIALYPHATSRSWAANANGVQWGEFNWQESFVAEPAGPQGADWVSVTSGAMTLAEEGMGRVGLGRLVIGADAELHLETHAGGILVQGQVINAGIFTSTSVAGADNGPSLVALGGILNTGTMVLDDWTTLAAPTLTNAGSITVVNGGRDPVIDADLYNRGTITVDDSIYIDGSVSNAVGGTMTMGGYFEIGDSLVNRGVLKLGDTAHASSLVQGVVSGDVDSSGTIAVVGTDGTLSASGNMTISGNVDLGDGVAGNALDLYAGDSVTLTDAAQVTLEYGYSDYDSLSISATNIIFNATVTVNFQDWIPTTDTQLYSLVSLNATDVTSMNATLQTNLGENLFLDSWISVEGVSLEVNTARIKTLEGDNWNDRASAEDTVVLRGSLVSAVHVTTPSAAIDNLYIVGPDAISTGTLSVTSDLRVNHHTAIAAYGRLELGNDADFTLNQSMNVAGALVMTETSKISGTTGTLDIYGNASDGNGRVGMVVGGSSAAANTTATIDAATTIQAGALLQVLGMEGTTSATFSHGLTVDGDLYLSNAGYLTTLDVDGGMEVGADGRVAVLAASTKIEAQITNYGEIGLRAATSFTENLDNYGVIKAYEQMGSSPTNLTFDADSGITNYGTMTLQGDITTGTAFVNHGTLSIAKDGEQAVGTSTIDTLVLEDDSVLKLTGYSLAGTGHLTQLAVSEKLSIGGDLVFTKPGGVESFQDGNSFDVLTWAALENGKNTFDSITGLAWDTSKLLDLEFHDNKLTATVRDATYTNSGTVKYGIGEAAWNGEMWWYDGVDWTAAEGGAVLIGTAYDDTFTINDDSFHFLDGGDGYDVLKQGVLGGVLDLTGVRDDLLQNFEAINANGGSVNLTVSDVLHMTDGTISGETGQANSLVIFGGANNGANALANAAYWGQAENITIWNGMSYSVYTRTEGDQQASIWVQEATIRSGDQA